MSFSLRSSCLDFRVRAGKVKRGNWGLARVLQASDFSPAVAPLRRERVRPPWEGCWGGGGASLPGIHCAPRQVLFPEPPVQGFWQPEILPTQAGQDNMVLFSLSGPKESIWEQGSMVARD